jgi:hypothetical protein
VPDARTRPDDAFMVETLRQAAKLAPTILPGEIGTTAAEWLTGEANCHEGVREGGKHLQNLVDEITVSTTGQPGRTKLHLSVSTLAVAYDFARALIRTASTTDSPAGGSVAVRQAVAEGVARELERIRQEIHEEDAMAVWTALDVEMRLLAAAEEIRGSAAETSPPSEVYRIVVEVPAHLDSTLIESLTTGLADTVHGWEPADRDGWDANVSGQIVRSGEQVH